jgi:1-acyl-sn-glycerol-3-phosphate acyltransferase
VKSGAREPGQLIIFPQGTRVAPGDKPPYKVGVGVLYQDLGSPCVPVACNVGVFWPRHRIYRQRGLAVVEFLPVVEQGLPIRQFLETIEERIETRSDALMAEAGFRG